MSLSSGISAESRLKWAELSGEESSSVYERARELLENLKEKIDAQREDSSNNDYYYNQFTTQIEKLGDTLTLGDIKMPSPWNLGLKDEAREEIQEEINKTKQELAKLQTPVEGKLKGLAEKIQASAKAHRGLKNTRALFRKYLYAYKVENIPEDLDERQEMMRRMQWDIIRINRTFPASSSFHKLIVSMDELQSAISDTPENLKATLEGVRGVLEELEELELAGADELSEALGHTVAVQGASSSKTGKMEPDTKGDAFFSYGGRTELGIDLEGNGFSPDDLYLRTKISESGVSFEEISYWDFTSSRALSYEKNPRKRVPPVEVAAGKLATKLVESGGHLKFGILDSGDQWNRREGSGTEFSISKTQVRNPDGSVFWEPGSSHTVVFHLEGDDVAVEFRVSEAGVITFKPSKKPIRAKNFQRFARNTNLTRQAEIAWHEANVAAGAESAEQVAKRVILGFANSETVVFQDPFLSDDLRSIAEEIGTKLTIGEARTEISKLVNRDHPLYESVQDFLKSKDRFGSIMASSEFLTGELSKKVVKLLKDNAKAEESSRKNAETKSRLAIVAKLNPKSKKPSQAWLESKVTPQLVAALEVCKDQTLQILIAEWLKILGPNTFGAIQKRLKELTKSETQGLKVEDIVKTLGHPVYIQKTRKGAKNGNHILPWKKGEVKLAENMQQKIKILVDLDRDGPDRDNDLCLTVTPNRDKWGYQDYTCGVEIEEPGSFLDRRGLSYKLLMGGLNTETENTEISTAGSVAKAIVEGDGHLSKQQLKRIAQKNGAEILISPEADINPDGSMDFGVNSKRTMVIRPKEEDSDPQYHIGNLAFEFSVDRFGRLIVERSNKTDPELAGFSVYSN